MELSITIPEKPTFQIYICHRPFAVELTNVAKALSSQMVLLRKILYKLVILNAKI